MINISQVGNPAKTTVAERQVKHLGICEPNLHKWWMGDLHKQDSLPSVWDGSIMAIFLKATDMQTHRGICPHSKMVPLNGWQLSL